MFGNDTLSTALIKNIYNLDIFKSGIFLKYLNSLKSH